RSTSSTFFPFRLTTSTTGMISFLLPISLLRLLRLADEDVLAARAGHRSADQQQVLVGVHLDHLQVLGGHLLVAHVPGTVLVLPDSRRERAAADPSGCAVEHGTVRGVAAGVVPALHAARETLALADPADVHQLSGLEVLNQNPVADLGLVLGLADAHFL